MKNPRFYATFTILLFAVFLNACASKSAADETQNAKNDADIREIIAKADRLFKEREDPAKLKETVNILAAARNPEKRHFETEWKFAKYSYFLGRQTEDENKADEIFAAGESAGIIASRVAPDKPDGHFWYGANLGERAKLAPLTKGITSIKDIRDAMNKVIEIQPDYEGASAYDALGRIELETGMLGGKPEKAIEYLEKGLEINKNNDYIRLHLAQAYLAIDKKAEAKKLLEEIVNGEPEPEYKVEHDEILKDAKKLLEKRFR